MLVEPDRVSVPADEFIRGHAFDGRRAAVSFFFGFAISSI